MGGLRLVSNGYGLFRIALLLVAACGAGDTRIDPGDLALRDLLGVSPKAATSWDEDQRASARHVLERGLEGRAAHAELAVAGGATVDERIARTLVLFDAERARTGDDALGLVRVELAGDRAGVTAIAERATAGAPVAASELWISERWASALPGRGLELLAALAHDAGHASGPVVIAPGPRLPVIASYVTTTPPRLIVNPVLLAAQEPQAGDAVAAELTPAGDGAGGPGEPATAITRAAPGSTTPELESVLPGANPYSFYGSVAECAFAQRTRCESCLAGGNCEAITRGADGATECTTFAENSGRGYFLICINLALAISSVQSCAADSAPGCARDVDAANELGELENNANFLDDATCGGALDSCLAEIYGPPDGEFPGVDGGPAPPRPPRSTNVGCNDSCDNNNCETNASCGEGPSCNNSLSCDSACSSSNDQSGCGGNCNACTEDETGGGGSSGCGGDDSSNDDGGGCSSDSGGGDSGGSCGGDDSGGGGDSGGGCGGDDSGGGDSGGSCGGGDSGGGGGDSCDSGCSSDSSSGGGGSCDSGCSGDSGGGGGSCGGDSGGGSCGGSGGGGGSCGGSSGGGSSCGGGGGGGGSSSCNATKRRDSGAGATLAVSVLWSFLPIPAAAWIRRRARRKKPRPARDGADDAARDEEVA